VRLNRRGLGTGLLWSRVTPALLLLVAAGSGALWLGSRTLSPSATAQAAQVPTLTPSPRSISTEPVLTAYAHLPLMFEANQGQTDPQVKFLAHGAGYGLFLTRDEAVLALQRTKGKDQNSRGSTSVVRMRLAGAQPNHTPEGTQPLASKSNYLIGNDPSKWHRDVPQYARVRYRQVYPGVDLVYYGKQEQLEYDFQLAPGANPKSIQLQFEGSKRLKLDAGNLVLETADGDVHLQAPHVYQTIAGIEKAVDGRFALLAENKVGFEVGAYDSTQALVIDPVLAYSSYLGGTGTEVSPTVAVDAGFNFYLTGSTNSTNFPVAGTPFQGTLHAGATANVFVTKFDATGTTLVYSTYLGGSGTDASKGIDVDAAGDAYIAGTTTSADFPTSTSAFQTTPKAAGTHAFVSQLDPDGKVLKYSTYLSGSLTDMLSAMTLDNKGFVYVIGTTSSTDFPTAPSAGTLQPTLLANQAFFVSKLNPTSSGADSLVFSTYFGGGTPVDGLVAGGGIAVDNNSSGSNIFITGGTNFLNTTSNAATDFPIKNAIAFTQGGGSAPGGDCLDTPGTSVCPVTGLPSTGGVVNMDAFVAKINPGTTTGSQLLYSTYLGGAGIDIGYGIALDASGNAYVTGSTNSPTATAFPPLSAAPSGIYQPCLNRPSELAGACSNADVTHTDAFVGKINNPVTGTGSTSTNVELVYWSYLGGGNNDVGNAIAVDGIQGARVVGTTFSTDLKTLNAIQTSLNGTQDAFVARLDTLGTTGTTSQFVTYLGGSGVDNATGLALDTNSNTYITGVTNSGNFPLASGVAPFQGSLKGSQDAFVAKFGPNLNFGLTAGSPSSVNAGNQVSFTYGVTNNGDTTSGVAFLDNLGSGSGSAPANFVSASVSGGSCPSTPTNGTILCNLGIINGGGTATVTVNLTPTGAGTISNSGQILVAGSGYSKTASAPPVTVNSFTLSALPVTPVVVAGQPASYQITLTPNKTFSANISLSCSSGLPGGTPAPVCTFSTTPITLLGSSASTVTLTISTTARTTTTVQGRPSIGPFYAIWLPVTGLAFVGIGLGSRARGKGRVLSGLLLLALMTLLLLQPACSGSSSSSTTTGTPAGTYSVVITATSGTFSQTTPISLTVQ
jgi:Beta-propeller repeat/Domain of unknown function DUF11